MVSSPVPRIPGWVGVVALACALLLSSAASTLPESLQDAALYLGVGLAFASVGGIVFGLLMPVRPDWQGLATVAGIVIGVMPLLVVWHGLQGRSTLRSDNPPSAVLHTGTAQLTRARTIPYPHTLPVSANAPSAAPRDASTEPLLDEVADLIQQKAARALERQDGALSLIANRHSRAPIIRTTLASASRELKEVQTALAQIKANEARSHGEVAAVIGDTTPLEGLITALGNVDAALDAANDPDTLRQLAEQPQGAAAAVRQWIADCAQRIADLRRTLPTAS